MPVSLSAQKVTPRAHSVLRCFNLPLALNPAKSVGGVCTNGRKWPLLTGCTSFWVKRNFCLTRPEFVIPLTSRRLRNNILPTTRSPFYDGRAPWRCS